MVEKKTLTPDRYASESTKPGRIPERLLLMTAYGVLSLIIGLTLMGGMEAHGAFEPLAFLTSWATVVWWAIPKFDLEALFFVFPLYLIFILLLNTLLAMHGKSWLKIIPLVIHGAGGFVAISMVDPEYRIAGWLPIFSIVGIATFWTYLAIDWRLATGKKKQPNG